MATYAIGDIHGCLDELKHLIQTLQEKAGLSSADRLVFVGDYIDRGPDSKGVIDYLIQLQGRYPCIFLMGNHEDMMLWYLGIRHGSKISLSDASQRAGAWLPNGGRQTLTSYGIDIIDYFNSGGVHDQLASDLVPKFIPRNHIEFLRNLSYHYIQDSILFVHAGIGPWAVDSESATEALERSTEWDLLWDRSSYGKPNDFGTLVYGHTPSKNGVRWLSRDEDQPPYSVGIDVGCVFGCNPLTAVRIEDWQEFTY